MKNEAYDIYKKCNLCPRNCMVDRNTNIGYCNESATLHVSRAALHMWEEPCISGVTGSGTVFFSGCNMGCVFCQNQMISKGKVGKHIDEGRLVDIFFELEEQGANNINLVTGDIFIPTITVAIEDAKKRGIKIPFLLNTSSYVNVDSIKMLDGLIDIYLPDFKYIRDEDAIRYSNAKGYADVAKAAIDEMVRQQPKCVFSNEPQGLNSLLKRGVVIRHLLMPGMLIQAKLIVRYLHERYGDNVYLSLMNQFTPCDELKAFPEINRKVTEEEYHSLVDYAANLGITKAYVQEGETAEESFIPEFDCRGV